MKKIMGLMAIASTALAACGSSSKSDTGTAVSGKPASSSSTSSGYAPYGGGSSTKTTPASDSAMAAGGAATVQMHDNFFGPKTITGKPGSTVKVTLKNVGQNQHNFKILGQPKADADVKPGQTASITVIIPKSGTAQFFCEYHKGLGMVGTVKPA